MMVLSYGLDNGIVEIVEVKVKAASKSEKGD